MFAIPAPWHSSPHQVISAWSPLAQDTLPPMKPPGVQGCLPCPSSPGQQTSTCWGQHAGRCVRRAASRVTAALGTAWPALSMYWGCHQRSCNPSVAASPHFSLLLQLGPYLSHSSSMPGHGWDHVGGTCRGDESCITKDLPRIRISHAWPGTNPCLDRVSSSTRGQAGT